MDAKGEMGGHPMEPAQDAFRYVPLSGDPYSLSARG